MRLAVCALSAVLLSGCSWLGTGGQSAGFGQSGGAYGGNCAPSGAYGGADTGRTQVAASAEDMMSPVPDTELVMADTAQALDTELATPDTCLLYTSPSPRDS